MDVCENRYLQSFDCNKFGDKMSTTCNNKVSFVVEVFKSIKFYMLFTFFFISIVGISIIRTGTEVVLNTFELPTYFNKIIEKVCVKLVLK